MGIEYKKIDISELKDADKFLNLMGMSKWHFKIDADYCFIAKIENKIVGISAGRLSKDSVSGFAGVVAVDPAHRRRNIIKKLHHLKIDALKKAGAVRIYADASNPVVTKYLTRDFGFRILSSAKNGQGLTIDHLILDV